MKTTQLLVVCGFGMAASQALACYTVYDANNRVVHQSDRAPVDMSLPLHQTLPKRFPGGHLVFDASASCQTVPLARQAPNPNETPLLTDARTAASLKQPHTILPSGAAVIRQTPATMRPGGTGSIEPAAPVSKPSASPSGALSRGVVITEMHNPPITAVQPDTWVGALR